MNSNAQSTSDNFDLALSPSGKIFIDKHVHDQHNQVTECVEKIEKLFKDDYHYGLLHLGFSNFRGILPQSVLFWQNFSKKFITQVCFLSEAINDCKSLQVPLPIDSELQEFVENAPFMKGYEYVHVGVLIDLWHGLNVVLNHELLTFSGNVREYLDVYGSWHLVGRVCFNLAENTKDKNFPFAFLATYIKRLSDANVPKHIPLGNALDEYAGEKNKAVLLSLLLPIQRAASHSIFIKELVDSGNIFRPFVLTAQQAYVFLKDSTIFEAAGVMVRVPDWWKSKKRSRVYIAPAIGEKSTSIVGLDSLLDFNINFSLENGEKLSAGELQELLNTTEPFVRIRGQWVEVDQEKLKRVLAYWNDVQRRIKKNGLTLAEGLRLINGSYSMTANNDFVDQIREWSHVEIGAGLKHILHTIRNPHEGDIVGMERILNEHLYAVLRPYQCDGVKWLWLLYNLRLGGCLADDMGLGKTIQIIALLLVVKYCQNTPKRHLLVIPVSLIGNWGAEIRRFAPELRFIFVHPSIGRDSGSIQDITIDDLKDIDLVVTTYSFVGRLKFLTTVVWDLIILDEAQAIKNPGAKQTHSIKRLTGNVKIALTGTPIENNLTDLWSLADFFVPGLLGSLNNFDTYSKKIKEKTDDGKSHDFYKSLRGLMSPYILRRLKNDKSIIADLPDKTEINTFCGLSAEQILLYQQAVEELKLQLTSIDSTKRRGIVFSFLMRFKQLCNHPAQWLGHGNYAADKSGKFLRLKELCQEIADKQEKVLIFTQFQEIIPALSEYLAGIFGKPGLVLHGKTPIKKRAHLVDAFAHEQGPPFFILSLKAGGVGLNLTSASHVIHFDRWWNPAIENQATDRAYRIGQQKNVLVYKFICQGTIEEKIDTLINSKKHLASEILEFGSEVALTELTDEQLIDMVALDIHRVFEN